MWYISNANIKENFMVALKNSKFGNINISKEAIASICGESALSCYGVVGIASKSSLHSVIAEILKKDSFARGVTVSKEKNGYSINLYLVIARDVKITEVLSEVQKKVKYDLEKTFSIKIKSLNVFANDIK